MKKLYLDNFYCWSEFSEEKNIDFHSYVWAGEDGTVVFDPLPITEHDLQHLRSLGPVNFIVISNSDHIREALTLKELTGAPILGPEQEKGSFQISCSGWLNDSCQEIEGMEVLTLQGSKTNGELAFLIEGKTLITGDLIRAHKGGSFCLLPDQKLTDKHAAIQSVKRIADIPGIEAVLPGDGWPIFRQGSEALKELAQSLQ